MLRYAQKFWWLILAWLLAIFGFDFWQFNILEVFATLAIIVGVGIAIYKSRQEKKRQEALIQFTNDWSAQLNRNNNVVSLKVGVNVLIPYHSYLITALIYAGKKLINPQKFDTVEPMTLRQQGRITATGEIPLPEIPGGTGALQIQIQLVLDGKIKKSSEKRNVPIVDISQSISDTKGS